MSQEILCGYFLLLEPYSPGKGGEAHPTQGAQGTDRTPMPTYKITQTANNCGERRI